MDINEPLHGQIHLWMIAAVIILGYLVVVGNKYWAGRHGEDRRATRIVLGTILLFYFCLYAYLTFFYRTPMEEAHIKLEPFWSYREAFNNGEIARLGVARSILLNIAITIPLGYLLPAVYGRSKHSYGLSLLTILLLSLVTELIQLLSRAGLCETDDVINNVIGGAIGLVGYWVFDKKYGSGGKKR